MAVIIFSGCEQAASASLCEYTGDNLIRDANFSQPGNGRRLEHWTSAQHAGENSYRTVIEDGVLTVEKIGTQPWFVFRQRIDTPGLAGKRLALNAELSLELSSPARDRGLAEGGGLLLTARSRAGGKGKVLMSAPLLNEPRIGRVDWHSAQIVVQLPEKTRSVEVGFLLQADGTLQVRKPSLYQVDETAGPCNLTPGAVIPQVKKSSLR